MAFAALTIDLNARLARFESDLGKVSQIAQRNAQQMDRAFAQVGGTLRALGGLLAVGSMTVFIENMISGAAALDDLAEKTGASVEELSKLEQQARISGVQMETVESALIRLGKSLNATDEESKKATRALDALGLKAEDLKSLDTAQVLKLVAERMNQFGDSSGKTALAMDLFGKSGAQVLPFLKDLANDQQLAARVSTEQAAKAEELEKSLRRLGNEIRGAGQSIVLGMMPFLLGLSDEFGRAREKSAGLTNSFNPMMETMRALAVLGANFSYVFTTIGIAIAGVKEQVAGFASGGIGGFSAARGIVKQILEDERKSFDALEARLMNLGKLPLEPKDNFDLQGKRSLDYQQGPDTAAMKKAAAEAKRLAEQLSKQQTFIANQWAEDMEEQAKIMSEVAQLTDDYNRREREGDQAVHDARMKAWLEFIDTQREGEEVVMRLAAGFDAAGNKIKVEFDDMTEFARQAARNMQDAMADGFFDLMQGKFDDLGASFKATIDRMVANLLASQLMTFLTGDFGKTGKLGGVVGDLFNGLFKADGGPVSGGRPYIVGERGPELFVPRVSGNIVPHGEFGGGGGGTTIVMNVYAQDVRGFRESEGQIAASLMSRLGGRARRYS